MAKVSENHEKDYVVNEIFDFSSKTTLDFYGMGSILFGNLFNECSVCLIGGNCSTYRMIELHCRKNLVLCYNHKINLQINELKMT